LFQEIIFGIAVFRLTGNVGLWITFERWLSKKEGSGDLPPRQQGGNDGANLVNGHPLLKNYPYLLQTTQIESFLEFLGLVARKCSRTGEYKVLSHLVSGQMRESVPEVYKKIDVWKTFLTGLKEKIETREWKESDLTHEKISALMSQWRNDLVQENDAKQNISKRGRPGFVSHITATDVMECWTIERPGRESLNGGLAIGYGGEAGLMAIKAALRGEEIEEMTNEEEFSVSRVSKQQKKSHPNKRWTKEEKIRDLWEVHDHLYEKLSASNNAYIRMRLGLEWGDDTVWINGKQYRVLLVKLTRREFGVVDVEHICCKIYILIKNCGPALDSQNPDMQRGHTWPMPAEVMELWRKDDDLWSGLLQIAFDMVSADCSSLGKPIWCLHPREEDKGMDQYLKYEEENWGTADASQGGPAEKTTKKRTTKRKRNKDQDMVDQDESDKDEEMTDD
jgi:hypothetical protein